MTVHVAARDWVHRGWRGSFYPDDLPEEWQLDYYLNEFHALLVPATAWLAVPAADLDAWAEESAGRGKLFVELPARPLPADALDRLQAALGEQLGGVVAPAGSAPAAGSLPVARIGDHASCSAGLNGAQSCSWWEDGQPRWRGKGLVAACWPEALRAEPMALRRAIEALAQADEALLVFAGEPPSIEALRTARTVADLLGVGC